MRVGIVVFDKHWVDAAPLFGLLKAFGVNIEGNPDYGNGRNKIKGTHLVVEGNLARWVDVDEFADFIKEDYTSIVHYVSMIYQIKQCVKQEVTK